MGRPPKIKKEEFEGPNANLSLNIASNLSNKTTNSKPNIIDDRSFRNDLLLARPDSTFPLPNDHVYSSLYGQEMELMRKMFKTEDRLDSPLHYGNSSGNGNTVNTAGTNVPNLHNKYDKTFPSQMFGLAPGQQATTLLQQHQQQQSAGPPPPPQPPPPFGNPYYDLEQTIGTEHGKDTDTKSILFPPPGYPFASIPIGRGVSGGSRKGDDDAIGDTKPHPGVLKPVYNDRKPINLNFLHKTKTSLNKPTSTYRAMPIDGREYDNLSPTSHSDALTANRGGGNNYLPGGDSSEDFVNYNFNVNDTNKNPQSPFLNNQMNHHVNNNSHMNKNHHGNINSHKGNGNNNNDYYFYNDAVEFNLNKSLKSDISMGDYDVVPSRNSPSISPRSSKSNINRHLHTIGNKIKDPSTDDNDFIHHHLIGGAQRDVSRSPEIKSQPDDIDDEHIDREERDDEFMNL